MLTNEYITSQDARRGASPEASFKELELYKRWLKRVLDGSKKWSENQPFKGRDLPLQGKIVPRAKLVDF